MALYLHLGPFSRYVIQEIEDKIEEIEIGALFRGGRPIDARAALP
jgi:hypothetical protein